MTFDAIGIGRLYREDEQSFLSAAFQCRNCWKPHSAGLADNRRTLEPLNPNEELYTDSDIETLGWYVYETWPSSYSSSLSLDIPAPIRNIFDQAETNFYMDKHEEAAAIMYRKALETALRHLGATGYSLYNKIESLIALKNLGQDIISWAHQVRLIGNDAAHDSQPPSKADLTDLRGITKTLLDLLFVTPALIKRRREAAGNIS